MEATCQLERTWMVQNLYVYLLHLWWKKSLTYSLLHGRIKDRTAYPKPSPTHLKYNERQDAVEQLEETLHFLKNFTATLGCTTLTSHHIKMLYSCKITSEDTAEGKLLCKHIPCWLSEWLKNQTAAIYTCKYQGWQANTVPYSIQ